MIRAKLTTSTDQLAALQNLARVWPGAVRTWAKKTLRPFVSQQVDQRLRITPGGVHYPIQWTSEKQRLAFFATDGFGNGIPYRRTGNLPQSWHVRGDYRGGLSAITVTNDAPQSAYVYGDETGQHQQVMHQLTGWPRFVDVAQVIALEADAVIEDAMPALFFQTLRSRR